MIWGPPIWSMYTTIQPVRWLIPSKSGIYIKDMLNFGLSEEEIRIMVADNPARILGI